jgi:hypothetical protein
LRIWVIFNSIKLLNTDCLVKPSNFVYAMHFKERRRRAGGWINDIILHILTSILNNMIYCSLYVLSWTNILEFWFVLNTGSWVDSSSLLIMLWLVRMFLLQFDNCPFSFSVWLPGKVDELMFLVLFLKRINVRILVISFVELWDCKSFQGYES